jgi:hypothetical protein
LLKDFQIAVEGARALRFLDGILELGSGHAPLRALKRTQQSPLADELGASMDGCARGHAAPVYTRATALLKKDSFPRSALFLPLG